MYFGIYAGIYLASEFVRMGVIFLRVFCAYLSNVNVCCWLLGLCSGTGRTNELTRYGHNAKKEITEEEQVNRLTLGD